MTDRIDIIIDMMKEDKEFHKILQGDVKTLQEDMTDLKVENAQQTRDISDIKNIQQGQAKDIEEHIKRTNLLEDRTEKLEAPISLKRAFGYFMAVVTSLSAIGGLIYLVMRMV